MATRGRKPKPTALKLLEGNPGKRPINENEPIPPKGTVKCPTWLEPEAKKEWKRLAPSLEAMGVLTQADLTAFAGYCQAYARWKEAEEFISQHGPSSRRLRAMYSRYRRSALPSKTSRSCRVSARNSD